jgi:2-keto-3-deoxy-6-phosphogluconate aldolase
MVKVFPTSVLSPEYIWKVHSPFLKIPLVLAGGIIAVMLSEPLKAGAALGLHGLLTCG